MADSLSNAHRHSLVPSFLYSSSSSSMRTSTDASPPSVSSSSAVALLSKRVVVPAPREKLEMYSPAFFAVCGVAGMLSTGPTHTAVTPMDVIKCNMQVNYVNAHATSTLAGDLAEFNAIKKVFKDTSEMKINGTKSMIGHGLGAAGGLEAIATIKAINTGWLHPTINQDDLEPAVTIDTVPNGKKQHEVNVAISNSFGFGGHNSVVVFAPFSP